MNARAFPAGGATWLNDIHSGLNRTPVRRLAAPESMEALHSLLRETRDAGGFIASSGCRHAMGGQQFLAGETVLDLRGLNRILDFDEDRGRLRAEAGIQWPELIAGYRARTSPDAQPWGIAQKQTGADTFTLGGSLSANGHGRGLTLAPFIQDVAEFSLLRADGSLVRCSRTENSELFGLAIGGYGLFGIITDVTLQLVLRRRLERVVEIRDAETLPAAFEQRIREGFLYGDFQFSIDETSEGFLRTGVFSCYRPTDRPLPARPARELEEANWLQLLYLAYTDRARAYEQYADYYLSTSGQVYESDTHQLGPYLPDYAARIQQMGATHSPSSLLISELYVPRDLLPAFLQDAAVFLRETGMTVIYGTVRLIEKDAESFLPWAREKYACVIFNLQVDHSPVGMDRARQAFTGLIDRALARGGNYFLTYHRFASAAQLQNGYPRFGQFLARKKHHDPGELFQSDWYRHYRREWNAE